MKFVRLPAFLMLVFLSLPVLAQKLKADEIVAKHLDSIGTAEVRAAAKSRMVVGEVTITFVSKKNQSTQGRVVMASEGVKNLLGMTLNANDYTNEKMTYDGDKAKIGFAYLSRRSPLGDFVAGNDGMLSQGLLGGALSTAWAPLNTASGKSKFSGGGIKKIDGTEVYSLTYAGKGADITMYFDKATFRHVRTEYKMIQSAGIGKTANQSSGYDETRIKLTEDFSDFRDENGLMLPHTYKINYSNSGQGGTSELEWMLALSAFTMNPPLAADTFSN